MTNLRTQFWLWLGKVLQVENGGVIDDGYAPRANQIPVVISPGKELFVRDPFGVTDKQREKAYEELGKLDQLEKALGSVPLGKKIKDDIFYAIAGASVSQHWFSVDQVQDDHWDGCSTQAIDLLQSLGFQDNADIQRYLDKGELPNER